MRRAARSAEACARGSAPGGACGSGLRSGDAAYSRQPYWQACRCDARRATGPHASPTVAWPDERSAVCAELNLGSDVIGAAGAITWSQLQVKFVAAHIWTRSRGGGVVRGPSSCSWDFLA
jgi:hypothetical protein